MECEQAIGKRKSRYWILASRIIDALRRRILIYWVVRAPPVFRWLSLSQGDRVLDVGCGQGLWTLTIAPSVQHVVGLDLRTHSVQDAKNQSDRQGHRNASFVVASATALPFGDNSFDKILSIDVLDNIPDDHIAACEMARVLKRGGKLVATALLQDRRSYLRPIRYPEHIRNYSRKELSSLVESAGLELLGTFEFYRLFSTVARELADIMHRSGISRIPGVGLLTAILLSGLARLDFLSSQPGGGFGVVATKPSRPGDCRD